MLTDPYCHLCFHSKNILGPICLNCKMEGWNICLDCSGLYLSYNGSQICHTCNINIKELKQVKRKEVFIEIHFNQRKV